MRLSCTTTLLLATCAVAPLRAQFRLEQYTSGSGLPQSTVAGLAQTPDGYLWIATFDGLARYDGLAFTIFDRGNTPAMRVTLFRRLHVDGAGTLWVGTLSGILRYRNGAFDWLPPDSSRTPHRTGDPRGYPGYVPRITRWRIENDTLHGPGNVAFPVDVDTSEFAFDAREDRSGALWFPGREGVLYRADQRGLIRFTAREGLPRAPVVRVAGEGREGELWLHTERELIRYRDGVFAVHRWADLGVTSLIRWALVDRDGTLWVGTSTDGVFRVSRRFLTTYTVEDGVPGRVVYPILQLRTGLILLGAGSLTEYDGRRFRRSPLATETRTRHSGLPGPGAGEVWSLHQDPRGRVWIGVGEHLVAAANGRVVERVPLDIGNPRAIATDSGGGLWVGGTLGLVLRQGATRERFDARSGLPAGEVVTLHVDRHGVLWVGTTQGLAHRQGGGFVSDTAFAGEHVRSIYEDADGTLWIGTFNNGLRRLRNGHLTRITTAHGLFSNGVFAILEDDRSRLWMSGNRGIFRVARSQLNDFAEGRLTLVSSIGYGTADGMRSAEANGGRQPAGLRARDGRLWFPTQDGVVVIDPAAVEYTTRPPEVVVERVSVDGTNMPLRGTTVRLRPGQTELEIGYTAPSTVDAPYAQFRHRMVGLGNVWSDVGTRREVHYSHLPPGTYVFEVSAAKPDGVWGEASARLAVIVEPFFYQTTWFRALSAAMMLAVALGGYSLRVRRLKAEERRLSRMVAERTADLRVANERLEQLAAQDPLTGLANHRRFAQFLDEEWQRSRRAKKPVSLVLLDVDEFKKFNDTRGHQAGDECLRAVASALGSAVRRGTDLAARYGGEEFVVVLPDTPAGGALLIAEAVRSAVEALGLPHGASRVAPYVTVSVGVATAVPAGESSWADLVRDADRALYRAKDLGRNRVEAS